MEFKRIWDKVALKQSDATLQLSIYILLPYFCYGKIIINWITGLFLHQI
jgi:hypothetical protein